MTVLATVVAFFIQKDVELAPETGSRSFLSLFSCVERNADLAVWGGWCFSHLDRAGCHCSCFLSLSTLVWLSAILTDAFDFLSKCDMHTNPRDNTSGGFFWWLEALPSLQLQAGTRPCV